MMEVRLTQVHEAHGQAQSHVFGSRDFADLLLEMVQAVCPLKQQIKQENSSGEAAILQQFPGHLKLQIPTDLSWFQASPVIEGEENPEDSENLIDVSLQSSWVVEFAGSREDLVFHEGLVVSAEVQDDTSEIDEGMLRNPLQRDSAVENIPLRPPIGNGIGTSDPASVQRFSTNQLEEEQIESNFKEAPQIVNFGEIKLPGQAEGNAGPVNHRIPNQVTPPNEGEIESKLVFQTQGGANHKAVIQALPPQKEIDSESFLPLNKIDSNDQAIFSQKEIDSGSLLPLSKAISSQEDIEPGLGQAQALKEEKLYNHTGQPNPKSETGRNQNPGAPQIIKDGQQDTGHGKCDLAKPEPPNIPVPVTESWNQEKEVLPNRLQGFQEQTQHGDLVRSMGRRLESAQPKLVSINTNDLSLESTPDALGSPTEKVHWPEQPIFMLEELSQKDNTVLGQGKYFPGLKQPDHGLDRDSNSTEKRPVPGETIKDKPVEATLLAISNPEVQINTAAITNPHINPEPVSIPIAKPEQIVQYVYRQMESSPGGGERQIIFRLDPPELGEVMVMVREQELGLEARIMVGKNISRQNIDALMARFAEMGRPDVHISVEIVSHVAYATGRKADVHQGFGDKKARLRQDIQRNTASTTGKDGMILYG